MERKLEKQLNRLAFIAGVQGLAEDDEKMVHVLKSIALQAEKSSFFINPLVRRKGCVICSSLIRRDEEFSLDCSHFICELDCLAEILTTQNLSQPIITCPIKTCEITTFKSKIIQSSEKEHEIIEMLIFCPGCLSTYPVKETLKFPCGHRFCSLCVIRNLIHEDPYIKNRCMYCFEEIPLSIIRKLVNSTQLEKIRLNL